VCKFRANLVRETPPRQAILSMPWPRTIERGDMAGVTLGHLINHKDAEGERSKVEWTDTPRVETWPGIDRRVAQYAIAPKIRRASA